MSSSGVFSTLVDFRGFALAVLWALSQGYGLLKHALADAGFETALGYHVNGAAEEPLEVVLEAAQVEEGPARLHLDHKIEVTSLIGLPSGD